MKTVWEYAKQGGWRYVDDLLRNNPALAAETQSDGTTLLHYAACDSENASITRSLLLQHGANANAQNDHGDTPLHHAALYGSAAGIEFLVSHHADLTITNSQSLTPLEYLRRCASEEHRNAVLWELEARFLNAVSKADPEQIGHLLRFLPDLLNMRDAEGKTVLDMAVGMRSQEMWKAILLADSNLLERVWHGNLDDIARLLALIPELATYSDTDGQTPLHIAVRRGQHWVGRPDKHEIIAILVKAGSDVNAQDKRGFRPIHEAARRDDLEAAQFLLQHGADPNVEWNDNHGRSEGVLDAQAGWNTSGDTAWVELLLQYGFYDYQGAAFFLICRCYDDVEEAELVKRLFLLAKKEDRPFDVNALMCKAAEVGSEEPLKMLLSLGADVNHEGERGRPLNLYLLHFSENGSDGEHCVPMISAFIELGVDVNAIDRGGTALDIAFDDFDEITLAACLMRYGASSLARQDGRTVLHLLSLKAKFITDERELLHSLVRDVLAAKSVDLNARDAEGKTALDYANDANDTELVALLEQYSSAA